MEISQEVNVYISRLGVLTSFDISLTVDQRFDITFFFKDSVTTEDIEMTLAKIADQIRAEAVLQCDLFLNSDQCDSLEVLYARQFGTKRSQKVDALYTIVSSPVSSSVTLTAGFVIYALAFLVSWL